MKVGAGRELFPHVSLSKHFMVNVGKLPWGAWLKGNVTELLSWFRAGTPKIPVKTEQYEVKAVKVGKICGPKVAFSLFLFLLIFTNNSKLNKHSLFGREVALKKRRQESKIWMLGGGVNCKVQTRKNERRHFNRGTKQTKNK